jgi:tetratricopeptide (TPR) repeat protein
MKLWAPHQSLLAELDRVEALLASSGPAVELLFSRAALWQALGRLDEAKAAYVDILSKDPSHLGALTQLGALLHETGYRSAAITVYKRILTLRPGDSVAHVNLANVLWEHHDRPGARRHYESGLALDPNSAAAHQGMAAVLSEEGDDAAAMEHGKKAFEARACVWMPYRGSGMPVELLMLCSAVGGNIPLLKAIDDRIFRTSQLAVEFYDPARPLPAHSIVWNAIGDADRCAKVLDLAAILLKGTQAPVINPPEKVARSGRADNALRLSGIEGLVCPKIKIIGRETLLRWNAESVLTSMGFSFPLLIRAQGYHAGEHFVKLDSAKGIAGALATMPGSDFAVIQFIDAQDRDGFIRKYRVMMLDRRIYPLHCAVSPSWKVHYFSADMADRADHRAEDEAFLKDMPAVLGPRAMAALEALSRILDLDYAGADFSMNAGAEVILFEANATMLIAPPDAGAQWDYRRAPVQKALDAVTAMLQARARAAS